MSEGYHFDTSRTSRATIEAFLAKQAAAKAIHAGGGDPVLGEVRAALHDGTPGGLIATANETVIQTVRGDTPE